MEHQYIKTVAISVVLMTALLLSCDTRKGIPEYERKDIALNVVLFDSSKELNDYVKSNFTISDSTRLGFSRWYKNDPTNECTVYLVRGLEDERTYGHELMHCIYGSFHEEN